MNEFEESEMMFEVVVRVGLVYMAMIVAALGVVGCAVYEVMK